MVQAELATALLKADVKIKASDFDLKAATVPAAESARDRAESELRQLDESESTDPFAAASVARLAGALGLLEDDRVAGRVADGRDRRDEARALYRCAAHLASTVMPQLARLARSRSVLVGALQVYEAGKDPKDQPRINAVLRAAASLRDRLEEIRWKVGDGIDYPFEHADENVTLGKFAFPALIPAKDDIGDLLGASGEAINRLAGLYGRALGASPLPPKRSSARWGCRRSSSRRRIRKRKARALNACIAATRGNPPLSPPFARGGSRGAIPPFVRGDQEGRTSLRPPLTKGGSGGVEASARPRGRTTSAIYSLAALTARPGDGPYRGGHPAPNRL